MAPFIVHDRFCRVSGKEVGQTISIHTRLGLKWNMVKYKYKYMGKDTNFHSNKIMAKYNAKYFMLKMWWNANTKVEKKYFNSHKIKP